MQIILCLHHYSPNDNSLWLSRWVHFYLQKYTHIVKYFLRGLELKFGLIIVKLQPQQAKSRFLSI